jgi:hypothetical protein
MTELRPADAFSKAAAAIWLNASDADCADGN